MFALIVGGIGVKNNIIEYDCDIVSLTSIVSTVSTWST